MHCFCPVGHKANSGVLHWSQDSISEDRFRESGVRATEGSLCVWG